MQFGELIEAVNALPNAVESPIFYTHNEKQRKYTSRKAILDEATGEIYNLPSKHYKIISHCDSFSKIIGAMNLNPKEKVKADVFEHDGRARLSVTFPELLVDDGAQGIELGFRTSNSYCGDQAFKFFGARSAFKKTHVIEFFGLRKVCSNGMMARIPLNEVKEGDRVERKEYDHYDRTELATSVTRIVHKGNVDAELFNITSAIEDLRKVIVPLENRIALAKETKFAGQDIGKMLREKGFSEKLVKFVRQEAEDFSNWGIYNGITNYASTSVENLAVAERAIIRAQMFLSDQRFKEGI